MEKRISLIPLFLFLILSASLMLMFSPLDELLKIDSDSLTITCDIEEEIEYSQLGLENSPIIEVYNHDFTLFYSLNGGQDFISTNENLLDLNKLNNIDITRHQTSIRWKTPGFGLPEMKNVVVKLVDRDNGIETDQKVLSYYPREFTQLSIVHLTIKEDELFDWEKGIMITGKAATENKLFQQKWWYKSANFAARGFESGRIACFQFFDKGKLVFESESYMKISGNASRYFPQKSMKFVTVDHKRQETKFEYPFWGKHGNKSYESIVLRQSGNDNTRTLFADVLMHELAKDLKVIILNGYPVSVFINGNYWGIYNLRERIDNYMLSKRENVNAKSITILNCERSANICRLVDGDVELKNEFEALLSFIEAKDFLSREDYLKISNQISVKSFIDYIFFETYYANQDWLLNNTTWFKSEEGKWKWILNDLDASLTYPGDENLNSNLFATLFTKKSLIGKLFSSLMTVKEFKEKFLKRAKKHLEEIFNEENLTEKFKTLKSKYEADIQFEIDRWRSIDSYSAWEESCAANLKFLIDRKAIYLKQLKNL